MRHRRRTARTRSLDIVLDNPEIFLCQVGNDDPVAMRGPSAADPFDLREGWYLDFPGDALEPGCVFEQDFWRFCDGQSVTYAHIATEVGRPGSWGDRAPSLGAMQNTRIGWWGDVNSVRRSPGHH